MSEEKNTNSVSSEDEALTASGIPEQDEPVDNPQTVEDGNTSEAPGDHDDVSESETAGDGEEADDAEGENDAYLMYLTEEYRKYRIITLVFAIIGFSTVLAAIGLSQANMVPIKVFNLMMSIANLFIVLMLVFAFTRTRPFRKKIKSYDKYYVSIVDPEAEDGVRIEQRNLPDMDDFFKIFERQARTELIPETDEYKRLRKTWIALYIAAAVTAVVAIALYLAMPNMSVAATIILLAAFILVIVAFYFDRTRMRPLRTKWARDNYGMSEFQVRDRMHEAKELQKDEL